MKLKKIIPWTALFLFSAFALIVFGANIPTDDQIAKIIKISKTRI